MRRCRPALLVGLLAAACACGEAAGRGSATISRDQFIETNVELRRIDPNAPDASQLRADLLRERGITEEDLRAFLTARSDETADLARTWEEIERRLEAALAPDTVLADTGSAST